MPPQYEVCTGGNGTGKEVFEEQFKILCRPNEKILAKQMALWKSLYYDHFKLPLNIVEEDGEVKYQIVHRRHMSNVVIHVHHNSGTFNLKRHDNRCKAKVNTPEAGVITVYTSGCNYKEACHCVRLVIWIACCCQPFSIVTDPELLKIFADLHAPCKTPFQSTIIHNIKDANASVKKTVIEKFAIIKGKIHVSTNGWSSPQAITFIGVVAQFIEDGVIKDS